MAGVIRLLEQAQRQPPESPRSIDLQRPPPPPPGTRLRGVPLPPPGEYDGALDGIPYKQMSDGGLKAFTSEGEFFSEAGRSSRKGFDPETWNDRRAVDAERGPGAASPADRQYGKGPQHGTPLCRHSLGAGTERRDR